MEIENTKESIAIVFKNNSVFIGVYIVPLFIIVPLIISKITVQSIIMSLIVFTYLNIGNYIAMRNIGSIETITLKNESLIIRRLKRNKKITYEKEIFFDKILKIYYQEIFLGFHKRNFNFDVKRTLKIKTQFYTYSFGYKMSYEDFKKANTTIEEKIKNYKNFIEKKETKKLYIEIYNLEIEKRYEKILNIILDEEKLYLLKKNDCYIVNADSEAIKNLEIFKNMNFKEIDFYIFYVNYLSKKEYEDKKVLVGYNGVDGKKVTMSKFKEDINEIRDSGSTFRN
ncbi:hypothetical protein HMPREF9942_01775 [Fusobacterium animalis F0419]|uniref:Uncharacterized protein n=1 Tax=Fusobacterium animalis F0419 TaxID=999414 RepID=H1HH24_9FUSO|nr:hypothetical protein [Fusobacterium animalis]EHO76265.1 hypothetical protein HMPREF9942_01775 [Fusobacterium animalis F0419]